MSYVRHVLLPNEKVIMLGKLHWIIFLRSMTLFGIGTSLIALEYIYWGDEVAIAVTAILFYALALGSAVHAWFISWITEFAVTNLRVIYKRGFIARHTAEMNMDKVESVDVDQSVPGRILGYGTIHVLGTGQGIEHLHRIESPIQLRNAIVMNEHAVPPAHRA